MKRILAALTALSLGLVLLSGRSYTEATAGGGVAEDHSVSIEVKPGTKGINIKDQAGNLKVVGRSDIDKVQVTGTAHGNTAADAEKVKLNWEYSTDNWIADMAGTITIDDQAGDIRVRNVSGAVVIQVDRDGDIEAEDVKGNITVGRDTACSITVKNVVGAFVVSSHSGGRIHHENVRGLVLIP